jgi:hypothetical protein
MVDRMRKNLESLERIEHYAYFFLFIVIIGGLVEGFLLNSPNQILFNIGLTLLAIMMRLGELVI